jgi:hypothetical protein
MWLEAMEEIDEVEVEFWETIRGKDAETNERIQEEAPRDGTATGDYS